MVRALRDADAVFVVSPDLALAFVAMVVARVMRVHRVLIVQDVMPDAAIELGMLRNRSLITITKYMARWIYNSADAIYTLGEGMRKRIAQMTVVPEKIQIVPNTIDVAELAPGPHQGKPFRDRFVPPDVFAIVHTGNMGEKQDLDLLLRAARLLKNERTIHFYVFGDGAVKAHFLRCLTEWELTNVSHFPFQERAIFAHALYGADVLLLSQRPEAVDIVVPSKLMTAMGAGAMIVAACPPNSETARILLSSGGGLIVPSSDENALVEAILRVKAGEENVQRHRERVRTFAEHNFDRRAIYMPVLTTLRSLTVNRSAS
jgi:colanic acid biosynthesis glycosyl transferase WcaI